MIRGKHPRIEGIWPQYSNLKTGLAKNVIISDVLTPDTPIESWKSEPKEAVSTEFTSEFDYADSHNHYQNLLSEVWNFTPNINGVAIWGDSGSFVPGSKAWGGFLSARSWPLHWDKYVPGSAPKFKDENFDAQLVGLEIDVLNGGLDYPKKLPGAKGPLAKTGLQIVGFGARNSAAIEIRSEDSDAAIDHDKRRGTWDYGIIAHNALDKDSTLLFAAYPEGRRGVDLEMADFSEGAIRLKSAKEGTGIIFNGGKGGEIYIDADNTLVLKAGKGGIKMINEYGIAISLVSEGGGIFRGWLISFLLVLALIALAINTVACWDKIIVLLKKMRLEKQTLITTRRS